MGGILNGIPKSIDGIAKDAGATMATITNVIKDLRRDASGTLKKVSNECIKSIRIIAERADETSFLLTSAALALAATISLSILLYLSHFSALYRTVIWTMYAFLCLHMIMTYIRHSCSRVSPKYQQQKRTPCRYGRECRDKNNIHHCSKYSHPVERISCRHGRDCRDQNDDQHCLKYSHPVERISCRHGRDCRDQNDDQHCLKYSHPVERISCRHGRDCRDQNDDEHCLKYSHPVERISCRHGRDCRDQNDDQHCLKYLHPDESKSKSLPIVSRKRIPCRYRSDCRDKNDPQHHSKYSHPKE